MIINNMSGKFLIAAPGLNDPNFNRSVVLICEHTKDGAFGLIVNRILMNSFTPLLNAFDIKSSLIDLPVYYGGPVKPEQGYVLYSPVYKKYLSIRVSETLAVTASKDILYDIAKGEGPEKFIFTLGFSGWAPNQLEEEMLMDSCKGLILGFECCPAVSGCGCALDKATRFYIVCFINTNLASVGERSRGKSENRPVQIGKSGNLRLERHPELRSIAGVHSRFFACQKHEIRGQDVHQAGVNHERFQFSFPYLLASRPAWLEDLVAKVFSRDPAL